MPRTDEEQARLDKERLKKKKEDEKALKKLMETPEEKIKRRLEKKAKKHAKQDGKDPSLLGQDDPFGETTLSERFDWKKKEELQLAQGIKPKDLTPSEKRKRQRELLEEVERIKKRREEREIEKAQREEEMQRMNRDKERAFYLDWEKKEDQFHIEQAKTRAEIRLREGRAKPIDVISKNLMLDGVFDIEMTEPYKLFNGLALQELEELKRDIQLRLDLQDGYVEFWEAMMIVCEEEIELAKMRLAQAQDSVDGRIVSGMHVQVLEDVNSLLHGKTHAQLNELQTQILTTLESGQAVDVEYWEGLLKKLTVQKAKAKLREIHAFILSKRMKELEEQQREQIEDAPATTTTTTTTTTSEVQDKETDECYSPPLEPHTEEPPESARGAWDNDEDDKKPGEADDGDFSPELLVEDNLDGVDVVDEEQDLKDLEKQRREILEKEAKKMDAGVELRSRAEEEMYRAEATKIMEDGEATFNVEMTLPTSVYSWHDKYRPRKPRYFNRVHTGYEWNKYNQTHYDHDNPPPKMVQGYKFNIFYPDLIDKTKTPQYKLLPSDTNDTLIILFHAGPPYEDIAFKIVNKQWEMSHKRGFKCTFERGILHLYFNFCRHRYRR